MEISIVGITSAKGTSKCLLYQETLGVHLLTLTPKSKNWGSTASNSLTFPEILTTINTKAPYNVAGKESIPMIASWEKGLPLPLMQRNLRPPRRAYFIFGQCSRMLFSYNDAQICPFVIFTHLFWCSHLECRASSIFPHILKIMFHLEKL